MAKLRVVKSRDEFEGEIYESLAVIEGRDLAAPKRGGTRDEVGRPRTRVDAVQRVTGSARYTQDVYLPGMLHARFLRSPYPRARVRAIDTRKAEALPGIRGVLHRFNAPKTPYRGDDAIFREEVRFVGEEVCAVAADDEDTLADALRLITVDYEPRPHVVDLEEAMGEGAPKLEDAGNVSEAGSYKRGDVRAAFREADAKIEATYRTSTALHNALETHGAVAAWDGDLLTVWESTQSVYGVRAAVASALGLPHSKVRVRCEYMGGGFGAKLGTGKYAVAAALFAKRLGRPVRCVLTREEENLAAGNRSATLQKLRLAGRGGRITAIEHLSWSNAGQGKWVANPTGPSNALYDVPNVRTNAHRVVTNAGSLSAFRAPGYVEGTFALESAVDELALRLGIDPLMLRRRHAASQRDPLTAKPYSLKRLLECYAIGAREIGWAKRRSGGTRGSAPHRRRGLGMASQIWGGGGGPPAYATVHLNADGTVVLRSGTQDIGTGTRTVLGQICAEELGVELASIDVEIGDTDAPFGPSSGGSMTLASAGPAVRLAARDARLRLLAAAAGVLEVPQTELRIERGMVVSKGARISLKEVLGKLENNTVIGRGSRFPNPEDRSIKTFGAHFAQVEVDTETGEITVERIVAVHDVGRIVNPLTARSQVIGGVMQAVGFALSEERVLDRASGRVMNAHLEGYKVPTVRDAPEIVVRFVDRPDRANNTGAKGLGEPPIIPTAAAIANAVANAAGARVRTSPLTRGRVLEALAVARGVR